jgi:hypothetical protein
LKCWVGTLPVEEEHDLIHKQSKGPRRLWETGWGPQRSNRPGERKTTSEPWWAGREPLKGVWEHVDENR